LFGAAPFKRRSVSPRVHILILRAQLVTCRHRWWCPLARSSFCRWLRPHLSLARCKPRRKQQNVSIVACDLFHQELCHRVI
jgi:hypothetical protein